MLYTIHYEQFRESSQLGHGLSIFYNNIRRKTAALFLINCIKYSQRMYLTVKKKKQRENI